MTKASLFKPMKDTLAKQIARWLPKRVVLWAFVRVHEYANDTHDPEFCRAEELWLAELGDIDG